MQKALLAQVSLRSLLNNAFGLNIDSLAVDTHNRTRTMANTQTQTVQDRTRYLYVPTSILPYIDV